MAVSKENIKKRLLEEQKTLSSNWLTSKQAGEQIRNRLKKSWNLDKINTKLSWTPDKTITEDKWFTTPWGVILWTKKPDTPVDTTDKTVTATWITEEPVITETPEEKTLREKVAEKIAWKKTEEEKLTAAREEAGRWELVDLQKGFREEAAAVQTDLENIRKGLEAEWGAITSIAASRIREGRSAPLRDQLTWLVKWQELTAASLKEMDSSIDAILKARAIDRENEVATLTNQIEGSDLSSEEKNKLLTQLGQQTSRMKQEEEIEAFRQKEEIKADIKLKEEQSIAQTGLTLEQNVTLWKIANNFDVKEDSLIAKSVASMLKEWKTEQEINKILWGATDAEWNFVDDTQFARREKLRKEFEAKAWVKAYRESVLQHQGTISTLGQASWPGDVAAVFQFMKTLDPTSVVRESEFKAAANAAWITEKVDIGNLFEKFKNWAILWEQDSETRKAFVETVNELFKIKKSNYDWLARQMINQAIRDWVDPKSVVLDLDEVPGASDLTRDDFNLLNDDDLLEVDWLYWFSTSDWKSFNIDLGFNKLDQTSWTKEDFIKAKEWFRQEAYLDSAWVPTIWYWLTSVWWEPVKLWQTITKEEAEREFKNQIAIHSNYKDLITVPLSPSQEKALASFEFNLWPNIWESTWKDIINAINKWDIATAKSILLKHNKARNPNTRELEEVRWLTNRRIEEWKLLEMIS